MSLLTLQVKFSIIISMTVPIEKSWAIMNTEQFLKDLLDPKKTPKVPKAIRTKAYWCLRHYPHDYDMERARDKAPEVFGDNPVNEATVKRSRLVKAIKELK